MTSKGRRKVVIVSTVLAVAVFAVCGMSAAANVSGYERLKAAGFNTIENIEKYETLYPNATMHMTGSFYADGVEVLSGGELVLSDGEKSMTFSRSDSKIDELSSRDDGGISVRYSDNSNYYLWSKDGDFYENKRFGGNMLRSSSYYDEDDTVIQPAQRRFIEAVADALVGDMRNYFVTEGNVISISLRGGQIPEIAQFALAAVAERATEAIASGDEDFPFELGLDAYFTDAYMEVELDDMDNIVGIEFALGMASTVEGETRTLGVSANFDIKDVGVTIIDTPETPNPTELTKLTKPEPPAYFL